MSTRNLPGVEGDQVIRLIPSLLSVSPLSRKSGSPDISQPLSNFRLGQQIQLEIDITNIKK
jgi:hypothetical protein